MANLTQFGNNLYTGKTSVNFVGKRRLWYSIAVVLMAISVMIPLVGGGFNFGIEFRGGSQFQITGASTVEQQPAIDAVQQVVPGEVTRVTTVGTDGVRVQTDQLSDDETREVAAFLADAYGVPVDDVTASFIGPSWGADITEQAVRGLLVFLALASIIMALYFRTWKMSVAAMVALLHDLVITAGVYAATGFEVTPAAIIGFLTILGFSLYDTVVVFDKVRENTGELGQQSRYTFAEAVNLAVNQTLVRSINTGVVAALPVAAILFIGSFVLGADTLRDISLALLVGIIVGTYSTIFIAAPLYAQMREGEPEIRTTDERTRIARGEAAA
ncbi:protein translocase subunit SecF [Marisediminicola antarctica]|uniref:Protein-export membrane protein SecF n=1 Tax=Marisediminicola antarctica TaxID=674079 RepID=A0A7L5AIR2_9MICO|nr:protein translocase subunit SecF [Marisediminicola antarctica]QHO69976.1 protein-export membrane protein SecF [Marisediminicola antarctica]